MLIFYRDGSILKIDSAWMSPRSISYLRELIRVGKKGVRWRPVVARNKIDVPRVLKNDRHLT